MKKVSVEAKAAVEETRGPTFDSGEDVAVRDGARSGAAESLSDSSLGEGSGSYEREELKRGILG